MVGLSPVMRTGKIRSRRETQCSRRFPSHWPAETSSRDARSYDEGISSDCLSAPRFSASGPTGEAKDIAVCTTIRQADGSGGGRRRRWERHRRPAGYAYAPLTGAPHCVTNSTGLAPYPPFARPANRKPRLPQWAGFLFGRFAYDERVAYAGSSVVSDKGATG